MHFKDTKTHSCTYKSANNYVCNIMFTGHDTQRGNNGRQRK